MLPLFGGATLLVGALLGAAPDRPEADAGPDDGRLARPAGAADRDRHRDGGDRRRRSISSPMRSTRPRCSWSPASIDHETGTRDITRLGGLRAAMPRDLHRRLPGGALDARPAAVPRLLRQGGDVRGARSRRWHRPLSCRWPPIVGNALMFAIALAVALKPFMGPTSTTPKHAHEAPLAAAGRAGRAWRLGLAAGLLRADRHALVSSPLGVRRSRPGRGRRIDDLGAAACRPGRSGSRSLTMALGVAVLLAARTRCAARVGGLRRRHRLDRIAASTRRCSA